MDFDWTNPPFNLPDAITIRDVEESFEDPFAVRLMPDSSRFAVQSRYFNLGLSANQKGISSVYRTNVKQVRVLFARPFEPEDNYFYQRKVNNALNTQS